MKKYCKNCKWYDLEPISFSKYMEYRCKKIIYKKPIIDSITGQKGSSAYYIGKDKGYEILNKKNNCKYYKCKWYKFWVKNK